MKISEIMDTGCIRCGSKDFTITSKGEWGIICNKCSYQYYWQKFNDDDYRLIREYTCNTSSKQTDVSKWNASQQIG